MAAGGKVAGHIQAGNDAATVGIGPHVRVYPDAAEGAVGGQLATQGVEGAHFRAGFLLRGVDDVPQGVGEEHPAAGLSGLRCHKTALTAPDYPGGRNGVAITDETFTLAADVAVLALGFVAEPIPGLKTNDKGCIVVDKDTLATSQPSAYAGGDAVTGANTLVHAMAAGKKAARSIMEQLHIQ